MDHPIIIFVLCALAVYRLSVMIATEQGAWFIFARFRNWITTRTANTYHRWISIGFSCVLCVSFWLSLLTPFVMTFKTPTEFILYWLGCAGLVLFLWSRE